MTTSSARITSIARRAVLTAAVAVGTAIAVGHFPAQAMLCFEQLSTIGNARIANENTNYQSVMKEIGFERTMADNKLAAQLKICTTAQCKAAQRDANAKTQKQLDVQEEQENAAHAKKLAQIKADIAAEEKANAPQCKASSSPDDDP
jgi:hypothetical protein